MAATVDHETDQVPSILPPEKGKAFFDKEARRITGLSGDEFLRRYDAGDIVEDDESSGGREVMYLIMLIPFGRSHP